MESQFLIRMVQNVMSHLKKVWDYANEVFTPDSLQALKGDIGVGHVRYSTAGESVAENAQPLVLNYVKGTLGLAHNGNLINALELGEKSERRELFSRQRSIQKLSHTISQENV